MGVYWVAMWTLRFDAVKEFDSEAAPELLEHIKMKHPSVTSTRVWNVSQGLGPARPGRVWIEEYDSLTAMDNAGKKEDTPECKQLWDRVYRLSVPGTFRTAIWTDPLRASWKIPAQAK